MEKGNREDRVTDKEHTFESKWLFNLMFYFVGCDNTSHLNPKFGFRKQFYQYVASVC